MKKLRAYFLCRGADQTRHYTSWQDGLSLPTVVVDDHLPDWSVPDDAGVLITHQHYRWENLAALRRIYEENRVPILILCDGILEYRNTWQHPALPDGSLFQPAFGHKIACLGRAPARMIESWGNPGRCEVVGLPQFDGNLENPPPPPKTSGPFRLLVATATTPAFDDRQRATVVQSLKSLKTHLLDSPVIDGRPLEVIWRLTAGLDEEVELVNAGGESLPSLGDAIDAVDAVITTPSTIYLESVLKKRPTALLDFHGCPSFLTSGWTINAESQIDRVVAELANPPAPKMLFQTTQLHDQLECWTPSAPRMIELVEAIVETRRQSLESQTELRFPARILTDSQHGISRVPNEFDLATLFEKEAAFKNQDTQRLQIELVAAIGRLDSLSIELTGENYFEVTGRMRARIREMHDRIVSLRSRLGVVPNAPEDLKINPDAGD